MDGVSFVEAEDDDTEMLLKVSLVALSESERVKALSFLKTNQKRFLRKLLSKSTSFHRPRSGKELNTHSFPCALHYFKLELLAEANSFNVGLAYLYVREYVIND